MKRFVFVSLLAIVLGFSSLAYGDLVDNKNGLIYDTDRNITWYDAWSPALKNWNDLMTWGIKPISDRCQRYE
jgi:hypothetical protein